MKIDKERFAWHKTENGKKAHIFPKNHLAKALCLRGPACKEVLDDPSDDIICKECVEDYPAAAKSASFAIFVG
ncbi:MAG: hypothetical protein HY813_03655 [Candidatus Portnoybacteria bacterium]|nr:hypothetical protein [Candidatus Portnoybacteria bacterium]